MTKDEIIKQLRDMAKHPTVTLPRDCEALRAAADLLAQPEQERNALPKAMNVVIAAMQADPGYAWSWHCNIAMAYVDEGVNRDVANQGAARFMKLLANVEPAHDILPTQTPDTKLNEQEPVAWAQFSEAGNLIDLLEEPCGGYVPLYTTPPQRKPLTIEQLREHWQVAKVLDMTDAEIDFADYVLLVRDAEALHGIKGEQC